MSDKSRDPGVYAISLTEGGAWLEEQKQQGGASAHTNLCLYGMRVQASECKIQTVAQRKRRQGRTKEICKRKRRDREVTEGETGWVRRVEPRLEIFVADSRKQRDRHFEEGTGSAEDGDEAQTIMICERQEFSIADWTRTSAGEDHETSSSAPQSSLLSTASSFCSASSFSASAFYSDFGFGVDLKLDASVASFAWVVLDLSGLPHFNFSPEFRNLQ
ncbi:hypothetical protein K438DRAFT_1766394 [Mycena galopus ATCC 62051]|nr:hypothetical protein K438DRAFT_1766394 [Mycena galopus ATCC 62051]